MSAATPPGKSEIVFVVSQPRAGSTLLEWVIAGHPEVMSTGETWLMLNPAYGLKTKGLEAEYDANLARMGMQTLIQALPGGEAEFWASVGSGYGRIYAQSLAARQKRIFLDKTPRYYLILKELRQLFPQARVIFLLRNPLAVLASIKKTWKEVPFHHYRGDLLDAPRLLLEGIAEWGTAGLALRYEDFVSEPDVLARRILEFMGLDWRPEVLEYAQREKTALGDPTGVWQHSRPVTGSVDRWSEDAARSADLWVCLQDYLEYLGPKTLAALGYSFEQLQATLRACRPGWTARLGVPGLQRQLDPLNRFHWPTRWARRIEWRLGLK